MHFLGHSVDVIFETYDEYFVTNKMANEQVLQRANTQRSRIKAIIHT